MPDRYRVRLTPEALGDLEEIHAHIFKESPTAAASMIGRILDSFDSLELFPHRTVVETRSPSIKHPVRSLPVKPYIIYFRVIDEERVVVIRHIRHGARRKLTRFD